jgi:hypothetical protein
MFYHIKKQKVRNPFYNVSSFLIVELYYMSSYHISVNREGYVILHFHGYLLHGIEFCRYVNIC